MVTIQAEDAKFEVKRRSQTPQMSQSDTRNFKALLSRSMSSMHPSQHPSNTSKSKQMFTFGIGQRFKKPCGVM